MRKGKKSGITPYAKRLQEVTRIFDEFSSRGLSVHALQESYLRVPVSRPSFFRRVLHLFRGALYP